MIINKYNIEKWMFDYFEDNLTQHERIELERFLEKNKQFEEEFEFWKESYHDNVEVPVYEVPEGLYKASLFNRKSTVVALGVLLLGGILSVFGYHWINQSPELSSLMLDDKITEYFQEDKVSSLTEEKVEQESFVIEAKDSEDLREEAGTAEEISSLVKTTTENKAVDQGVVEHPKELLVHNAPVTTSFTSNNKGFRTSDERGEEKLVEQIGKVKNNVKPSAKRRLKNKETKFLQSLLAEGKVSPYHYQTNSTNERYTFLEFKRSPNRKRKANKDNVKTKSRNKEYLENIAIISTLFYKDKAKLRQKRRGKIIGRLKNEEIALINTHDPVFVLTNSNPTVNNLALVGGVGMPRIKTSLTNRWRGSVNEQNKAIITGDTYFSKLNAGVGIEAKVTEFTKQNYNSSSVGVTYSQRIQLKEKTSLSVGAKYAFNMHNYQDGNQSEAPLELTQNYVSSIMGETQSSFAHIGHSFSTALWYDGKMVYGGINFDNVKYIKNENNNANEFVEYINPFKFAIQLGTDYRRNVYSAWVVSPQVNYRYQQGVSELWLGSVLKYKRLLAGIGGSFSDAYKLNIGVQGGNLRLIYGFDYAKSKLENQFYGTHELSFRYLLRRKNNWKK
ncbi:MAG: type IX secretion system membrane protein PorP/SprF [Flavobacteriales bacterium]|jgi:type IX secretion system PorP/SprF family membrane protein|nr:type IX secretion system membrane protein PorP/SprF [Flavobacteriales bacterium]